MSETVSMERSGRPGFVVRDFASRDIDTVARFEADIAIRSFAEEAVTDPDHYRRKLAKLLKYGDDWTKVVEAGDGICGWAWVASRQNFLTGDRYADFRSFYINGARAGPAAAVTLLRTLLAHCTDTGFTRIVGRTAASNAAMRSLYELAGFRQRHIVYELDIGAGRDLG